MFSTSWDEPSKACLLVSMGTINDRLGGVTRPRLARDGGRREETMTEIDVAALRACTPGGAHRVHLNNAGAGLLSGPTLTAITSHLRLEAEIGGYEAAAQAQDA